MSDAGASIWQQLAAPLPKSAIEWRQDGKPFQRDGKTIARFVAFVGSAAVRERLDAIVPGEWTLALEQLPTANDADGVVCAMKARLSIRGIAREDVGLGRDAKAAATDSLKRAAGQFKIGSELHEMSVFVQLDGDGKGAKPIESPQLAWDRKHPNTARPIPREVVRPPIRGAPLADVRPVPKPSHTRAPEPPPLSDDDVPF